MSQYVDHFDRLVAIPDDNSGANRAMGLWVRGEDVAVYELDMPDAPKRRWPEMVPWLLEDQLLRPAETLHFVVDAVSENRALVYVVAKETMNQWLMMADAKSITPQKLAPDFLALPVEDGYWTLSIQGDRMIVRTGQHTGFATEVSAGWRLLLIAKHQNEDLRFTAIATTPNAIPVEWRDDVSAQSGELNWGFVDLPSVNLLQGDYKPKNQSDWRAWAPAVGLACAAALLAMVFMLVQSHQWRTDTEILEQGIYDGYEDLFAERLTGSTSNVQSAVADRVSLMEHQYLALNSAPLGLLNALDPILTGCSQCDLQQMTQTGDTIELQFTPTPAVRSRLDALDGVSLDWGAPDGTGVVTLNVSRAR